jgi:molecular chaperone DnaK (HSP70)
VIVMVDKPSELEIDEELGRLSSLYAQIPEQEFSPRVSNRIRTLARQSSRKTRFLKFFKERRLHLSAGLAFALVAGFSGMLLIQQQSEFTPMEITTTDDISALLRDTSKILAELERSSIMIPASSKFGTQVELTKMISASRKFEDPVELTNFLNDLEDKKLMLNAVEKVLRARNRNDDAAKIRQAIQALDSLRDTYSDLVIDPK